MPPDKSDGGFQIMDEIHRHTDEQIRSLAALEEARARRLIVERLPRTGPWLVEHPRVLAWIFRVRPSLRPVRAVTLTTAKSRRQNPMPADPPPDFAIPEKKRPS